MHRTMSVSRSSIGASFDSSPLLHTCACALELNEKCATYPIPEIGAAAGITSAALPLLGRRRIRTPPGCKDPCRSCGRQSAGSAAREPLVAS